MADYLAPVHDICNIFFAESPVDGTHLETRACALPQPRKYRTSLLGNAGHNCSREKSSSRYRGSPCRQQRSPRQWTLTVQECTVFVRSKVNNKHSPRILRGSERCGSSVGSLYGMLVVQTAVKSAGDECNERNLRDLCSPGVSRMLSQEFIAMSEFARRTRLTRSIRSSIRLSMFSRVSPTYTVLTDQRLHRSGWSS